MTWISAHRRRTFFRSSLLGVPVVCMAAALAAAPLVRWIDEETRWALLGFGPAGAGSVLGALTSSLLTFIVFAFSLLLLAVQLAGGQLSPRIIARVFESRLTKGTLGVFVFSYTYALTALGRVEGRVPQLPVLLAVLLSLTSIALFLYLIQTVSQSFRPITILTRVANDTRRVIDALYPQPFSGGGRGGVVPAFEPASAARSVEHQGRPGVLVDWDADGLVEIARRAQCAIELVPQVGDFVATGDELFRLYGAGGATAQTADLCRCVALGVERVLDRDPAFGFRILVDVAIKALSPAINDPTTGVLALDQLQHLLHRLGQRQFPDGVVADASGEARLVYRTPTWEDVVDLAVTEIRLCGGSSPQITRRLQALFEHLLQVVSTERAAVVQRQRERLWETIDREFADPRDRLLARVADAQGLGSRQSEERRG